MGAAKTPNRRQVLSGAAAIALSPRLTLAQATRPLKIGVMNDMSGVYADYQGIGSVIAAKLAVEDHSGPLGVPVEIVSADHQNKPDVGAAIARKWFDSDGVDVIMDLPNSAVALAVVAIATEKNKAVIGSGAGTSVMTGPKCSRDFVQWTYDTYELGHGLGHAVTEQGGKTWFFITADYAFGKDLKANCAAAVEAAGGKVVGAARHPINTADFSSFLLQAQASGADVVAFANAGGDSQQLAETGPRIRPRAEAAAGELRPQHHQHARARTGGGRGRVDLHAVLLGLQRRHARLRQALPGGASAEDDAQRHAGGHVCGDRASDEGDGAGEERRRRDQAGRRDEGDPDRRSAVRQGQHPRRRPRAASGLLWRSNRLPSRRASGTVSRLVATIRPEDACAPSTRAGARS